MRETLRTCRLQKSTAEETLHNVTQDMAKWRFEALKSRCVIINRETLLEEKKIPFDDDKENISKMAQRLDNSMAQPNIVDASACILRPTTYPKRQSINLPRLLETSVEQIPIEEIRPSDHLDIEPSAELQTNKQEDKLTVFKPKIETNSDTEIFKKMPVEITRSPLQTLQQSPIQTKTTRMSNQFPVPHDSTAASMHEQTCDISAILSETRSSINSFVPQYRNISINKQSMASLEKNMARLKPSSTPRCKNVRRALILPDELSEQRSDSNRPQSTVDVPDVRPKVKFSDSTIEAVERKESGLPARKVNNVSPITIKVEPSESHRRLHPGINRRIMIKSKKPTVFPD